jgi:hypothetical protein
MDVPGAKRLKAVELENSRLKKLLADVLLENEVTRTALRKKADRTASSGTSGRRAGSLQPILHGIAIVNTRCLFGFA